MLPPAEASFTVTKKIPGGSKTEIDWSSKAQHIKNASLAALILESSHCLKWKSKKKSKQTDWAYYKNYNSINWSDIWKEKIKDVICTDTKKEKKFFFKVVLTNVGNVPHDDVD